jgi:poly(hydroxyalkanoate) granule-associated protein
MVKKRQEDAAAPASGAAPELPVLDGPLASAVRESAQQIWQAGLGAFAKAQGEGGKVFESLVREGVSLQKRTQAVAEERLGAVGSRMQRLSDEVQARAGQHWDRLESIFEQRVAKALGRLGVPTVQDLEALGARLDVLTAQVAALAPSRAARKGAGRGSAPEAPGRGRSGGATTARAAGHAASVSPPAKAGRAAPGAVGQGATQPVAKRAARTAAKGLDPAAKSPRRRKPAPGSDG